MDIQLSREAIATLKSFDRTPDSEAALPRPVAEELLTLGLAYESRVDGAINMTAAGRRWLNQRA